MYSDIYLSITGTFPGDITLRFTNYGISSGYFIGTDVIPGSVQVWRSGIQDSNFNYNSGSGEVTINGPVGQNEIIRITYLKTSVGMRFGSIAAGFGAIYKNPIRPFSAQAAVGVRWNMTDLAFTEESVSNEGIVGFSAKTNWDYDYLNAHITAGFTIVQTDTTGLYRAAGMDGSQTILPLVPESSFISNHPTSTFVSGLNESNRANLIYRNYMNNTVLGSNLSNIESNEPVVSGITDRPYPARDRLLGDSQVLVAEFELDNTVTWTGFQIPLGVYSDVFSHAAEIEIPLRFFDFSSSTGNIKLIIQIGSLSSQNFPFIENTQLIWEKELYPAGNLVFNEDGQIVRFILSDEERRTLADARYLRLIIINDGASHISGRLLLASPIIRGSSFRPVVLDNNTGLISGNTNDRITAVETIDFGNTLEASRYGNIIKQFHSTGTAQRILRIQWDDIEPRFSAGVDGRIGELPLQYYRELSFFVKPGSDDLGKDNETMRFIVASGPDSISRPNLAVNIPLEVFTPRQWSKVTIRYQGSNTGIYVDGNRIAGTVEYTSQSKIQDDTRRTSYVAFLFDNAGMQLNEGIIYIDEIILEDPMMVYRVNAGAGFTYSRPGILLSAREVSVLSDLKIYSIVESEGQNQSGADDPLISGSVLNRTGIGITVLGANISANMSFTAAEDTFFGVQITVYQDHLECYLLRKHFSHPHKLILSVIV